MKESYNEVYGWMPQSIVNNLSSEDRSRMFLLWLNRKPSDTGYFVLASVIKELGEEFLEYLFGIIIYELSSDDQQLTKDDVMETTKNVLDSFAADTNLLTAFVETYFKNTKKEVPAVILVTQKEDASAQQPRDSRGRFAKK